MLAGDKLAAKTAGMKIDQLNGESESLMQDKADALGIGKWGKPSETVIKNETQLQAVKEPSAGSESNTNLWGNAQEDNALTAFYQTLRDGNAEKPKVEERTEWWKPADEEKDDWWKPADEDENGWLKPAKDDENGWLKSADEDKVKPDGFWTQSGEGNTDSAIISGGGFGGAGESWGEALGGTEGQLGFDAVNDLNVVNNSGKEITKETMENIVASALIESGDLGRGYLNLIEQGDADVTLTNFTTKTMTAEEAVDYYRERQDMRNGLVNDIISLVSGIKDPKAMLAWLATKVTNGTAFEEGFIKEMLDENSTLESGTTNGIISELQTATIDTVLNAIDELHYDIEDIEGGTYIEAEIVISPKAGSADAGTGVYPVEIFNVALIKKNGVYVCDWDNALNEVTPGKG